ncbi:MAG: hypothetical protein EXQ88_00055 [Alphaproteobacteria bacterium]|nr:hypothetical protein [Alphaproteobacteria bacterium]
MLADLGYHLPGGLLRQADAVAQLIGLDLRLPFLDRRVLDFALGLAPRLLTPRSRRSRPFLARLLRQGGVPENIWRHAPRPLPVSAARLLRTELRGLGTRLLDREADRLAPLLDPQAIRRLWRAHATRKADHAPLLWNALSLATWLEQRDQ